MKIGILTYHRSHNYGALLQAIALRYQLVKMGHTVYFINYWPIHQKQLYDYFSMRQMFGHGVKGTFAYIIKFIFYMKKRKMRINSFLQFIDKYIKPYCIEYSSDNEFDAIIYGSDQIWRKQPGLSYHFNSVYFADNILKANKHISYAASMGSINLQQPDYCFLKEKMKKFTKISVREDNLKDIIKKVGFDAQVVLDPTLLLTDQDWNTLFSIKKIYNNKYILYYRLLRDSFDEKRIRDFAMKTERKLIVLEGAARPSQGNSIYTANPEQFLSLIKYADFIFTSSYHGLVFSLIFNKQFFASFATNADRAKLLLNKLNIENRLLLPKEKFPFTTRDIEYKIVNEKIDFLRKESINYISQF